VKYLQLKLAMFLGRVFPRRIGYGIARRIADLYMLFDQRGRKCVVANLQQIHQYAGVTLTPRALHALARENFLNFAKYLVDFFHFIGIDPARLNRLIEPTELWSTLDALRARNKGVIILSAHLGNWELGAAWVAARGYPIRGVALQYADTKVNNLYWRQRAARGLSVIPVGRAARECLTELRHNGIIALIGDRDFSTSATAFEFFGKPARLPVGPAKLALATGAPILPVFMVRVAGERFRYVVVDPIFADPVRDTVETVMRRIARVLEQVILQHSEQWFLFHNPWDIEQDLALATATAFGRSTTEAAHKSAAPATKASETTVAHPND
jgi:KDO2-lipid IV(A) lauroyltransferase